MKKKLNPRFGFKLFEKKTYLCVNVKKNFPWTFVVFGKDTTKDDFL